MLDRIFDNYVMTPMQKIVLNQLRPEPDRDAYGVAEARGFLDRIYAWLELKLSPDVEQTIFDWQERNRAGAQGTHHYTAEQYGLTTDQIRSDYDFYIRHFDVAVEG